MTELLYWFLVSQTLSGLPAMDPGTQVRVVSPDLLTIHAMGRVVSDTLLFTAELPANAEVRLLVFPPDASEVEVAQALAGATALRATVTADGRDLLVSFQEAEGFVSFRMWLEQERGVTLVIRSERSD